MDCEARGHARRLLHELRLSLMMPFKNIISHSHTHSKTFAYIHFQVIICSHLAKMQTKKHSSMHAEHRQINLHGHTQTHTQIFIASSLPQLLSFPGGVQFR